MRRAVGDADHRQWNASIEQRVGDGVLDVFFEPEGAGQVTLWIEINQQHAPTAEREGRAEVGGGGGFPDPAFLIGNGDNGRHVALWASPRRGGS